MTIEQPGMRERKKLQTRQTIEIAAVELVLEHGFDGVTIEAIAERADVTPRTFFNHFADKADAVLGIPRDRPLASELDPSAIRADSPFAFGVAFVRSGIATLNESTVAADKQRREIFAQNPSLLAREMEKFVLIEESITELLDARLADEGMAAGPDRHDRAFAITLVITAAARLAFSRWSRETASATDLVIFFDHAVDAITSTLTLGKT
jgi:AcrR family transcriptional regulator